MFSKGFKIYARLYINLILIWQIIQNFCQKLSNGIVLQCNTLRFRVQRVWSLIFMVRQCRVKFGTKLKRKHCSLQYAENLLRSTPILLWIHKNIINRKRPFTHFCTSLLHSGGRESTIAQVRLSLSLTRATYYQWNRFLITSPSFITRNGSHKQQQAHSSLWCGNASITSLSLVLLSLSPEFLLRRLQSYRSVNELDKRNAIAIMFII